MTLGTKILFLEDDILYQESIKDILEDEDFIIETCNDGQEFLDKIFDNIYDLYIIDINVPKIDGFEIMNLLKEYNDTTMKLVLTSISNTTIKSFKNGCDDFLSKNTDMDELLLRIKTLIKRAYKSHKNCINITNNINYDIFSKKLFKQKEVVDLKIRSLLILDYLIKKRGEFVASTELEKRTYPCSSKSKSDVIRYHIWDIRNAVGKNLIESRKNFGYKLLLQ
jgi:DNA-binding response OmpR family regulator